MDIWILCISSVVFLLFMLVMPLFEKTELFATKEGSCDKCGKQAMWNEQRYMYVLGKHRNYAKWTTIYIFSKKVR